MMVKLVKKSMQGAEIYLAFFEDGEVSIVLSKESSIYGTMFRVTLRVEGGFLIIKYKDQEVWIPIIKLWQGSWELSDEEIRRIKEVTDNATRLGNAGRDKVEAVIRAGGIPEIENAKEIYKEVYIRNGHGRIIGKVDLVVEKENERLTVLEVKTTTISDYLEDNLKDGIEDLEEKYKLLINKYSLDLRKIGLGVKKAEDIEAYISFSVYFDIKNKKANAIWSALSP